jgi:integrase
MPAEPRGWTETLKSGERILRYRDLDGNKQRARSSTGAPLRFTSKTKAMNHFRDVIAPQLRGDTPDKGEVTLREFVPTFLERHGAGVRDRTIATLRDRLGLPNKRDGETPEQRRGRERNAVKAFGDVPLRDLARMADEIAGWQATLPPRSRHGLVQALGQCLKAAKRWGYMDANPVKDAGPNPKTPRRPIRPYKRDELDAIAVELAPAYRPLPKFAAATGLRPEEWLVLERADVDRRNGVLNVRRTLSSGEVVELAKTSRSRRQVPLNRRALEALDEIPPRLDTPLLFPAVRGGVLDIDNWRRRKWAPAIEASGVAKPARIYDLRATYASESISAGIGSDQLARVMGTSVAMIEEHYGVLLDGTTAAIAAIQDAYDTEQEDAARARLSDDWSDR